MTTIRRRSGRDRATPGDATNKEGAIRPMMMVAALFKNARLLASIQSTANPQCACEAIMGAIIRRVNTSASSLSLGQADSG